MADKTKIEWSEATWNPVTGCTRVSPGCLGAHCYIERQTPMRIAGRKFKRVGNEETTGLQFHPERLDQPLRWRRPRMIFVNSMSDLFHEEIPDGFIAKVFNIMAGAHQHTFQVLTKRPERAADFLPAFYERVYLESTYEPLRNVWLGVSIENARYTWRADVLREIPAAVRFISAEPLLGSLFGSGSVQARRKRADVATESGRGATTNRPDSGFESSPLPAKQPLDLTGIDWLIVGGESGGKFARPMHPDWARELRGACLSGQCHHAGEEPCDDCVRARPAFFFKQWGSWAPLEEDSQSALFSSSGTWVRKHEGFRYAGSSPKSGGRLLDGREWSEMPVREELAAHGS